MKLHITIEYRTRWGERLVLRLDDRRIALQYADGGLWHGSIELPDPAAAYEYGYEVRCDDGRIRREWRTHRLELPAGLQPDTLRLRDRWLDVPADRAFCSSAFTRGIFGRGEREETPAWEDCNLLLRLDVPAVPADCTLALAGSGPELGGWQRVWPLDDSRFPRWELGLKITRPFRCKFLLVDRRTLAPRCWEQGEDRVYDRIPACDELLLDAAAEPRFEPCRWRGAGTAVPVFSLRSTESFGIGEFCDLKLLADWAAATGQRILQLLPINDTTMTRTWEDSYPYNANSTFALHPQFIRLQQAGVEADEEFLGLQAELNALPEVDYERVNRTKERLLRRAFARREADIASDGGYRAFVDENRGWLIPYAAFRTLRDDYDTADFSQWGAYAAYDAAAVEVYCREHEQQIAYHCWVQYQLHLQLADACRYARERGIVLKGDLPIGISRTSCDAWLSPELFRMDAQAGAPPDAFSAFGQNWGFPTYDWERMAQDDYAWWRARLRKMAAYFDAYRIDHILGFFRIWEIPTHAVHGLLGCFNPALPYSADELREQGFDLGGGRHTTPPVTDDALRERFGELAGEVRRDFMADGRLRPEYDTQRKVAARLRGGDAHTVRLREGLLSLLDDVLFIEDPRRRGCYHPRIGARNTCSYRALSPRQREAFDRLHDDFFYRRHNAFWQQSAMRKLPMLLAATDMLACGEDLGMIPDCVPETMRALQILSLEIQRMPKSPGETFADPAHYPYLSVCTTSTHDMNPLRAWWEEDRSLTERFFAEVLGGGGEAPRECGPAVCRRIVGMHLSSPAMLAVLPLQDWLSTDGELRSPNAASERINVPAVARHYWRYRMHLTLEELLSAAEFNARLRAMIADSGRR